MATGKSCSRWFAPIAALLMVVSLSGCFDKEGDQRKAFIDFLQNTVMRSGERLPTLTADQKKTVWPLRVRLRHSLWLFTAGEPGDGFRNSSRGG